MHIIFQLYPKWFEVKSAINRPELIDEIDPDRPEKSVDFGSNDLEQMKSREEKKLAREKSEGLRE